MDNTQSGALSRADTQSSYIYYLSSSSFKAWRGDAWCICVAQGLEGEGQPLPRGAGERLCEQDKGSHAWLSSQTLLTTLGTVEGRGPGGMESDLHFANPASVHASCSGRLAHAPSQ